MKKIPLMVLILTASCLNISYAPKILSQSFPYPPNSTFFTGKSPTLQGASVPFNTIYIPDVPYYFTFDLPNQSIQSIGSVTIKQNLSPDTIVFLLNRTQAFLGMPNQRGSDITLKSVTQDTKTEEITIEFNSPIPPGTTFTVGILAQQNPSIGGSYIFRVNALPAGANPIPMNLGVGRIEIYDHRW